MNRTVANWKGKKQLPFPSIRLRVDRRGAEPETVKFRRLHVLEFDSDRKRMSVVVRDRRGAVRVVTKGAESSVLPRCDSGPAEATARHIDDYAGVGLRTLAVAVRRMGEDEYAGWAARLEAAGQALSGREEALRAAYGEAERGLELVGAVAVEDKLQEDVTGTLVRLGMAGVKVWVLTGDKRETAVNISYSCGHFQRGMEVRKREKVSERRFASRNADGTTNGDSQRRLPLTFY